MPLETTVQIQGLLLSIKSYSFDVTPFEYPIMDD